MIVDSSALIAMIQAERHAERIAAIMAGAGALAVPAPTATECLLVLTHRYGAVGRTLFERVQSEFGCRTVDYTAEHVPLALRAYTDYGKGRHRAALNFGDCMTYASARLLWEPLLCVGDDFIHTDLVFDDEQLVGTWPDR